MKKSAKIFLVIFGSLLYVLLMITISSFHSNYSQITENIQSNGLYSCDDTIPASAVFNDDINVNQSSSSSVKYHHNYSIISIVTESILSHQYSKYLYFDRNIIDRIPISDFIFPHHYF